MPTCALSWCWRRLGRQGANAFNHAAQKLEGDVGLLFTSEDPSVVTEWFDSFKKADFARSGNVVAETFELPAGLSPVLSLAGVPPLTSGFPFSGPIMIGEAPAPHSIEPQFRKLGLVTSMVRGVPTLTAPHTVCTKGDALNANQVQLLKLFMKPLATVSPPSSYSSRASKCRGGGGERAKRGEPGR